MRNDRKGDRSTKQSSYNTINIRLTTESRDKIRLFKGTISRTVRYAIDSFYENRFLLIRTYSLDQNKELYSLLNAIDWYRNDYMLQLYNSDSAIGCDMRNEGIINFKSEIVGAFSKKIDCIDFKDFLINKALNKGVFIYNTEAFSPVVPRYLFAPIDGNDYPLLKEVCLAKNTTIEVFLSQVIKRVIKRARI